MMANYTLIIIVLIVISSVLGITLFIKSRYKVDLIPYVTIMISIFALFGAYRASVFPFQPKVYVEGYFFPHTKGPGNSTGDSFIIGLPLLFVNEGAGKGVISDVFVLITNKDTGTQSLFIPIVEIDWLKVLRETRAIGPEHLQSALFQPFSLNEGEDITKTYVFKQYQDHTKYPYAPTPVGEYEAIIYMKTARSNYKEKFMFTIKFTKKTLEDYNSGVTPYISLQDRIDIP